MYFYKKNRVISPMKYRTEIDGLRAVAIIPVILFHAGFGIFGGGYTGVDIFFVISGFLITSIIYSDLEQNKFSLLNFYERRLRRILPLLFFVLLVTLPLAWVSLFQVDMIDYFESLISTSLFCSNFLFAFEANYFDASVDLKPLLHTWSLAIEEQYYLLFPLFMLLLWKYNLRYMVLLILCILGVISLGFMEWALYKNPQYNFYLLPSRGWELAIGSIVAISNKKSLLVKIQSNIIGNILSAIGISIIFVGFFIIKADTEFPSFYTIIPTLGAALVLCFAENSFVGKILSMSIIRFIGLISYSAYMWHHPIFAFSKHLSLNEEDILMRMLLTLSIIPISYLSWKYIENPFRNKDLFSSKFVFVFSILGSLLFISIGYIGVQNDGFPERTINTKLKHLNYNPDNRSLAKKSWDIFMEKKKKYGNKSWYDKNNSLPNILLIGNSHSKDLMNVFLNSKDIQSHFEIARQPGQIKKLAEKGDKLYKTNNYKEADLVVVVSHFYADDLNYIKPLVHNLFKDNKKIVLVKEPHIYKTINSKTLADVMVQKYLNSDNVNFTNDISLINQINKESYIIREIESNELKKKSDIIINELQEFYSDIIVLDRNDYICNDQEKLCYVIDYKFQKLNYDSNHNTIEGGVFFGKKIDEINWLNPILEYYNK